MKLNLSTQLRVLQTQFRSQIFLKIYLILTLTRHNHSTTKWEVSKIKFSIKTSSWQLKSLKEFTKLNNQQLIILLLSKITDGLCPRTTKLKSRLSYAELLQLKEFVHMVTLALSLMEITNSRRRNMCLLDIRPSYVNSSMKAHTVLMETVANSFTLPNLTKWKKRNKLKTKSQVTTQLTIWNRSLVTNKCWMTTSNA